MKMQMPLAWQIVSRECKAQSRALILGLDASRYGIRHFLGVCHSSFQGVPHGHTGALHGSECKP